MQHLTEKRLAKIQRISSTLRTICLIVMAIFAAIFAAGLAEVLFGGPGVTIQANGLRIPVGPLSQSGRFGLLLVLALSAVVSVKAIYHLHRLFGFYARGSVFTTQTAAQIRQLGVTAILWGGVRNLWPVAHNVLTNAPRPSSWTFYWDSFFIGAAIIAVSWFMEAAAEIQEENDLTI